jgi:hypothetical protein
MLDPRLATLCPAQHTPSSRLRPGPHNPSAHLPPVAANLFLNQCRVFASKNGRKCDPLMPIYSEMRVGKRAQETGTNFGNRGRA